MDELVAENWPGIIVTDDSLTKCISDIRQALGPGSHKYRPAPIADLRERLGLCEAEGGDARAEAA